MKLPGFKPLLRVIREKCLDCVCGVVPEVKRCPSEDCPLWPYRMGKNPFKVRTPNDTAEKREGPDTFYWKRKTAQNEREEI